MGRALGGRPRGSNQGTVRRQPDPCADGRKRPRPGLCGQRKGTGNVRGERQRNCRGGLQCRASIRSRVLPADHRRQKELSSRAGKSKRAVVVKVVPEEILDEAKKLAGDRMAPALLTPGKLAREAAVKTLTDEVGVKLVEKFGAEKVTEFVLKDAFYYLQKEAVRGLIMDNQKRLDGRGFDDIRAIGCEAGLL